jgi:hypothetical protein
MKWMYRSALPIFVFCLGCDQYKEDAVPTINLTTNYFPEQPLIIRLSSFIAPGSSGTFGITTLPSTGKAEVIKDSYLKYSSITNSTEEVSLDVLDADGNLVSKASISLVAVASKCGLPNLASFNTHKNESISIDIATSDLICEDIGQLILIVEDLENTNGLTLSAPPPGPNGNPIKVHLDYVPPYEFTGIVRAFYTLAINIKTPYQEKLSLPANELVNHPDYFKFFLTGEIEINVTH